MIRLVIKLALAALIANAAWQVGSAYASHYKFIDAVQQTTQYGPERSDAELRTRILELAAQYDLPLAEDGFTIAHDMNHTIVDGSLTRPIEIFPGYTRDWPFTFHTDTFVVKAAR